MPNFKKLPLCFLSAVALFFLSQALLMHSKAFWEFVSFYREPKKDDAIGFAAQIYLMPDFHVGKRIFMIGSSQMREDFDVFWLNREGNKGGMVFYNLGTSGDSPWKLLLQKKMLMSKKPNILVTSVFAGSFYENSDAGDFLKDYFNPSVIPYLLKYISVREMIFSWNIRTALIDSFTAYMSPIFKYRQSIQRMGLHAISDWLCVEKWHDPGMFAYENSRPRQYFEEQINEAKGGRYKIGKYTQINKALFSIFAKTIVADNADFIVITGLDHPLIMRTYDRKLDLDLENFLDKESKSIGFTYLSRKMIPAFTEEDFIDFTHLNARGRAKLSEFIFEYLTNPRKYDKSRDQ